MKARERWRYTRPNITGSLTSKKLSWAFANANVPFHRMGNGLGANLRGNGGGPAYAFPIYLIERKTDE